MNTQALRPEYINPKDIRVQGRLRKKDRGLRELAESMEKHSLLQPVRVRRDSKGGYTLVSGYRRLCAARRLAAEKGGPWETLPCIVVGDEDPVMAQAVENFQVTVRELEADGELEAVFSHAGVTFEDLAITRGNREQVAGSR
jgi:ParB family chromosome partitioning protein